MKLFDVVEATFKPTRTDDLKSEVAVWIGRRTTWMASWLISEEEYGTDHPYLGQYAMSPNERFPADGHPPFTWVPYCDLADIKEIG